MSALVIPFPRRSPVRALVADGRAQVPFTTAWCEQHLPLIEAGLELIEADDADFAERCAAMRDEAGRALVGALAGQLGRLGTCIAAVGDALGRTAARIRNEMTARA